MYSQAYSVIMFTEVGSIISRKSRANLKFYMWIEFNAMDFDIKTTQET